MADGRAAPASAAILPGPAEPGGAIAYRSDIDGLRAIAVSSVVFYHAGLAGIPGGFVGVDVFFVISGYLIGGQIYREASRQGFAYGAFYARRARRILPALLAMLLIVLAFGLLAMAPAELRQFGKEAVPATLGVSNILYYTAGDYFAPAAERSPLLMTWSLGVEEQFYLILPVLLLLVMRWRRDWTFATVALLSALSFVGSLALMAIDAKAAFYLLPTRAWELGIGVLLALHEERRPSAPASGGARVNALAWVGLAILAFAIVAYDKAYAFPGTFVLLPVIGAAVLIATRSSLVNGRLLGLGAMTFVGKVSYSWYLWHWPIFYLNRIIAEPGAGLPPPLLLGISFAMAVLSWRVVEQPLRRRVLGQARVLAGYGIALAAMTALGGVLYMTGGLPGRLSAKGQGFAREVLEARASRCLAAYGADAPRAPTECLPPIATGPEGRMLVLGDSHASAIAPGFAAYARRHGQGIGEITKSSCLPLVDAARAMPDRPGHWDECLRFQRAAFAIALTSPEVRTVVLAGYWDNGATVRDASGNTLDLSEALRRTVATLGKAGKHVILVQDVPRFRFNPASRAVGETMPVRAALMRWLGPRGLKPGAADLAERLPDRAAPMIAAIAAQSGQTLLDPEQALCSEGRCAYASPTALYYQDEQHLTVTGALHVVGTLSPARSIGEIGRLPTIKAGATRGEP